MRVFATKQRLKNDHTINGFFLMMVLIIAAFFLCAYEEGQAEIDIAHRTPASFSDGSETLEGQEMITVHLPGLPEDAKKLEMVLVKPGSFMMGSSKAEQGRKSWDRPWPSHKVTITKPFYIGKYEVTQAQWETLIRKNRSYFRGKPNLPVEKVTWRACRKFIKRLNALGQGVFRLPTEAEWEYACRAGSEAQFSFGDSLEKADRYMWWKENNEAKGTKEVGLKMPNPWGLYDMHGNVQEWCSDRWRRAYERGPQTDPKGPSSGSTFFFLFTNRVFRGGSFESEAQDCSASRRSREQSIDFHYSLGFRLVREWRQ